MSYCENCDSDDPYRCERDGKFPCQCGCACHASADPRAINNLRHPDNPRCCHDCGGTRWGSGGNHCEVCGGTGLDAPTQEELDAVLPTESIVAERDTDATTRAVIAAARDEVAKLHAAGLPAYTLVDGKVVGVMFEVKP